MFHGEQKYQILVTTKAKLPRCDMIAFFPPHPVSTVVEYVITVTTGGEEEEDYILEETKVRLTVYGQHGDSGPHNLVNNRENKPKFQPGQVHTHN